MDRQHIERISGKGQSVGRALDGGTRAWEFAQAGTRAAITIR